MRALSVRPWEDLLATGGLVAIVLASLLLLARCPSDTRRPPPPPLIPAVAAEAPDADSLVAWVLAGSPGPREGWTAPEPCWPVHSARCDPRFRLAHVVRATSEWEGVDPVRVARLIYVESLGDSSATGRPITVMAHGRVVHTRAVGLGQIVPEIWLGTWPECGTDLRTVRTNVCYTVRVWKWYRDTHPGDPTSALLAYNGCRRGWSCDWYADAVLDAF